MSPDALIQLVLPQDYLHEWEPSQAFHLWMWKSAWWRLVYKSVCVCVATRKSELLVISEIWHEEK